MILFLNLADVSDTASNEEDFDFTSRFYDPAVDSDSEACSEVEDILDGYGDAVVSFADFVDGRPSL